jgi:hypothetical protein
MRGKGIGQTVNIRDKSSSGIIRIIEWKKEQLWSNMSQSNGHFLSSVQKKKKELYIWTHMFQHDLF